MEKTDLIRLIESGQKNYLNKTRLYLAPCMEWYGEEVMSRINSMNYFSCNIDLRFPDRITYVVKCTFKDNIAAYFNLFNYCKGLGYVDGNPDLRFIQLAIPKSMYHAYDMFIKGQYSKMYTREQLEQIFIKTDPRFGNTYLKYLALPVLIKHPKRKEFYEDKINEGYDDEYSERITIPDDYEFDSMWKPEHEILQF
jgi:hypothetical protein